MMNGVNHVAIILDGNRRWARSKDMLPQLGHKYGAENLEDFTKKANKKGLKYLTVYVFSTENWKRSKIEVDYLMRLFRIYFKKIVKNAKKNDIKVRFFGTLKGLPEDLKKIRFEAEEITKDNTGLQINFCFNYGGRTEITETVQKIAQKVKNDEISIDEIDEKLVTDNLYSANVPDPEILIRTSGEMRLSNFLPWQLTYTEFFFINKFWPDFKIEDLEEVINDFNKRNRRFGAG